jgi:crossover junction endodeoxyribonuclease RusA
VIEITVYGIPGPQGSKRYVGTKNGKGMMVESSKKVKPWREAVKCATLDVTGAQKMFEGAVRVDMVFTMPKPKSAPKTRKTWPDRKPDLSKLIRSTEDALTETGVWEDDARVIGVQAQKVFPGEHPLSLLAPGVRIRVWQVNDTADERWMR